MNRQHIREISKMKASSSLTRWLHLKYISDLFLCEKKTTSETI